MAAPPGRNNAESSSQVPTFKAGGRQEALNVLAGQLGDGRAAGVRRKYGRPLKAVVILGTGELEIDRAPGS